jgi:hypothetical protein
MPYAVGNAGAAIATNGLVYVLGGASPTGNPARNQIGTFGPCGTAMPTATATATAGTPSTPTATSTQVARAGVPARGAVGR